MTTRSEVFEELGRLLLEYQRLEHLLKLLLPHMGGPIADIADWRQLLDSKETLGGLTTLFQERVSSTDPAAFERDLRRLVEERNEVVHRFCAQPFGRLQSPEACEEAAKYLQSRVHTVRWLAAPLQFVAERVAHRLGEHLRAQPTGSGRDDL